MKSALLFHNAVFVSFIHQNQTCHIPIIVTRTIFLKKRILFVLRGTIINCWCHRRSTVRLYRWSFVFSDTNLDMAETNSAKTDRDDDGSSGGGDNGAVRDDNGWREMGFGSKVKHVVQNITVEPMLALFQVSSVLSGLTTQNLNLQKACRVNLRMDNNVRVN